MFKIKKIEKSLLSLIVVLLITMGYFLSTAFADYQKPSRECKRYETGGDFAGGCICWSDACPCDAETGYCRCA